MKIKKRFWLTPIIFLLGFWAFIFIFFPLPGHIPVLMYHFIHPKSELKGSLSSLNVATEDFEKQMWFLKTFGYRAISLDEYYEIKTGLRKPRGKEILITFDDGHRTYLERALPILERYQLKSVNFLIWQRIVGPWTDYIFLSEAKKLSQNPLVNLQAHSITHVRLTDVSLSRAQNEIVQSKYNLEKALGREIHYFCYPEGSFSPDTMQLVQEAGYRMAFRTALKFYKSYPETPHSISRIKISHKYNLFVFWWYVSGLGDHVRKIDHFFHRLTLPFTSGTLTPYKPLSQTT